MNISRSNYNLYEPVTLTNEIPHLNVYAIMNRQIQNEWVRDLIGQTAVDYESYDDVKLMKANLEDIDRIPYDEEKEPEKYREALNKIIRYRSQNYNPELKKYVEPNDEYGEIQAGYVHKVNFSVDGLFETEVDYLMHEMHRYLFRLYPEHYNALTTLTPAERLVYFQEAGYMINSSFDLTNLPGETEEESFYMQHKFITNLATAMKYTGTLKQEVMLLNLLGKADVVKNVDYYVTDAETGVISNSYNGAGKVELRKSYQYKNDDSFLAAYADTLFANTEDTFRFATKKVRTEEATSAALANILTWYESNNTFGDLINLFNNIYKYSVTNPTEDAAINPVATDLTVEDLISKYSKVNLRKNSEPTHFVLSYGNKSAVLPFKETKVSGEASSTFSMNYILESQGKKFSNLTTLGTLPTSYEFFLGEVQYNEDFLNWISMITYDRIIASFVDNDFSLKYTECLRREIQYDWKVVAEVRQLQGDATRSDQGNLLLRGILSKDILDRAYNHREIDITIGDGEEYNPQGVTPNAVFDYLDHPKNMDTYKFGNGTLRIVLTVVTFLKASSVNLKGDDKFCCPHTGIPYTREVENKPIDIGEDHTAWPSISSQINPLAYQVYDLTDFSLQLNTVEIPYQDLYRTKEYFSTNTKTVLKSFTSQELNRVFFYNQVEAAEGKSDPTIGNVGNQISLNEDNICDFIFGEVALGETRLKTIRGYLIDDNHLKLESDISDLIQIYGRVDFFMVNCGGDRYFGKLNKAEVQNDYCLATIEKVSPNTNRERWVEDTVNVYIFAKTSEVLPDSEAAEDSMANPQEVLKVKPAQVNSIPYFICNTDELDTPHLRYLYNTIFSETPEVYYDATMREHQLYEPTTLVKYESILGVQGASIDDIKVCQDLIDEHKSLYIDSDLYANAIVPYVEKSVTYNGVADAISTNYNPNNLPAYIYFTNIDIDDYQEFEELYNAARYADEKDIGYIVKTYDNHLVIWGDVIWDTNEVDTVKRLRTIWSSFLSSFVVEDLKGRFPTMPEVKADADVNPIEIKLNNFNYSYNEGLPTVAYNLTVPGFKNPKVSKITDVISLSESEPITKGSSTPVLYPKTSKVSTSEFNPSFKIAVKESVSGTAWKESNLGFNNCKITFSNNYTYVETDDKKLSIDSSLKLSYQKDESTIKTVKAVNKFIESSDFLNTPVLFGSSERYYEFLAQQLTAYYAMETYGTTSSIEGQTLEVDDILKFYSEAAFIPSVIYVDDESAILALAFVEKGENGKYTVTLERHRAPNVPKCIMNLMGLSANESLIYEDDSTLKALQKIITEPGDYIPLGSEGYFTKVDLETKKDDSKGVAQGYYDIFSGKDTSGKLTYTTKKEISESTVNYINNKSSFTLVDKFEDGDSNEYTFTYNEKMFKEYSMPNIRIKLDESTLASKLHADLLLEFPYGFDLVEDENIILKDLTTPVTRATYTPSKEIMVVNRSYTMTGCNVIAKDNGNGGWCDLYLEDNEIRGSKVSAALQDLLPTSESNLEKGISLNGSTLKLGLHWKPSETPIDYKYYKRKFIAKGKIYASEPNKLIFDDLGSIKLKDHVSSADDMQLITLNILGDTIASQNFTLPVSGIVTDENKTVDNYTWKLLGASTEMGGTSAVFKLYVAGIYNTIANWDGAASTTIPTRDVIAGTITLSSEGGSFTKVTFPGDYTYSSITDVFVDSDCKFHFIGITRDSSNGSSTEKVIREDSAEPVTFAGSTTYVVPSSLDLSNSKLANLNLDNTPNTGDEMAWGQIGARSTKILTDYYGRISKKDGDKFILLNDAGRDNYTEYTLAGSDMVHDSASVLDNVKTLLRTILAGDDDSFDVDSSLLRLEKEDNDPIRKASIELLCKADKDGYIAEGKTIAAAIEAGGFLIPYKQTAEATIYTDSNLYSAKRTVNVLEKGTEVLSNLNVIKLYNALVSDGLIINNFGKKIFTSYTENDKEIAFFDQEKCILYVLNKSTNAMETIPLFNYLGEKWQEENGATLPLLTPTTVVKLGAINLNDELNGYKTVITKAGAAELNIIKNIFDNANKDNTDKDAKGNLKATFTRDKFENWIDTINSLTYSNPDAANYEFINNGYWPLSILTEALKASNKFSIDFEDILKDKITQQEITAVLGADTADNPSRLWKANDKNSDGDYEDYTYAAYCAKDNPAITYNEASFAKAPAKPTLPENTEVGSDGRAVVKTTIEGYTYTADDFKYETVENVQVLKTRLADDMKTIAYNESGNYDWRTLKSEDPAIEAIPVPKDFDIPAEPKTEEPTLDTTHYFVTPNSTQSFEMATYDSGISTDSYNGSNKTITYPVCKVDESTGKAVPIYKDDNGVYSTDSSKGTKVTTMAEPEEVEAPVKSSYNKWLTVDASKFFGTLTPVAKYHKTQEGDIFKNVCNYIKETGITTVATQSATTGLVDFTGLNASSTLVKDYVGDTLNALNPKVQTCIDDMSAKATEYLNYKDDETTAAFLVTLAAKLKDKEGTLAKGKVCINDNEGVNLIKGRISFINENYRSKGEESGDQIYPEDRAKEYESLIALKSSIQSYQEEVANVTNALAGLKGTYKSDYFKGLESTTFNVSNTPESNKYTYVYERPIALAKSETSFVNFNEDTIVITTEGFSSSNDTDYVFTVPNSQTDLEVQFVYKDTPSVRAIAEPDPSDFIGNNSSSYSVAKSEYGIYVDTKNRYRDYLNAAEYYLIFAKWDVYNKYANSYNNQSLAHAKYTAWMEEYYKYVDAVDTYSEKVKEAREKATGENKTYFDALYFYSEVLKAKADAEEYNQIYDTYQLDYATYQRELAIKAKVDAIISDHNCLVYFNAVCKEADATKTARDYIKTFDGQSISGWDICKYVIMYNESFINDVFGDAGSYPLPGSMGSIPSITGAFSTLMANQYFASKVETINIGLTDDYIYLTGKVHCDSTTSEMASLWNSSKVGTASFGMTLDRNTKTINRLSLNSPVKSVTQLKDSSYFADTFSGKAGIVNLSEGISMDSEANITNTIPISVVFNSGLFENVNITTNRELQVVNSLTTIDYSQLLTNKVGTIGKDFINLVDSVSFSNCESTEVIAFIEDQTKDNFQFGFNDLGALAEALTDEIAMFTVGNSSCADFAMRVNNYHIDDDTNLYYPIFEDESYPYPEDITGEARVSDFYATDNKGDVKILKNSLGRNILPIFPQDIELFGEETSGTSVKMVVLEEGSTGLILKKAYADPGKAAANPLIKKDENGKWRCISVAYSEATYNEAKLAYNAAKLAYNAAKDSGSSSEAAIKTAEENMNRAKEAFDEVDATNVVGNPGVYVPKSVVHEASTLLYKTYNEVCEDCGTLYELVSSAKEALIAKPYSTVNVECNSGSYLKLHDSYIELASVRATLPPLKDDANKTYELANISKNTTKATSLTGYVTVEALTLQVPYKTATLPKLIPITKFNKNLSTGRVFTYNTEIAFPLNGYGSSILDVTAKTEFFNPYDCKFAENTFFKSSGSGMKNTNGEVFKVYLGEENGEPVYAMKDTNGNVIHAKANQCGSYTHYFAEHSLNFGSFSLADKKLNKNLIPRDPEYAEMKFYTYNANGKKESFTVVKADCIDSSNENILRIPFEDLLNLFGESSEDFEKTDSTSLSKTLYSLAEYNREWVCRCVRESSKLDADSPYIGLSELVSQQTNFSLKSVSEVNELVGHTRRFNGSLATTVPANLTYISADHIRTRDGKRFENSKEVVQGKNTNDASIYACDNEGKLLRILSTGVISSGTLNGELINVSESAELSTDIRKVIVGATELDLNNISGVLISVDRNNLQKVRSGVKFVADGKLSYIYSLTKDVLSEGELNIIWKDPKDTISREAIKCGITLGDKIEFTYTATSSESYNYAILLDKDRNTVGQIYLNGGIGPNTLLSYIRA